MVLTTADHRLGFAAVFRFVLFFAGIALRLAFCDVKNRGRFALRTHPLPGF